MSEMYPAQCEYHRTETVRGALDLLERHADGDARLLAGGQGLVTDMKVGEAAPDVLVDIGAVDRLRGVVTGEEAVTVGALTTHADLASSTALHEAVPVLAAAAGQVGDRQVRNRGTIGGNLAEADPAADLPATVLAADGAVAVEGPGGERTVDARELFHGDRETALGEREVLTHVRLSRTRGAGAYVKRTHPATGYAMVGVAVDLGVADGAVTAANVAVAGVADRPTRLPSVEDGLAGLAVDSEDVSMAAERAPEDLDGERLVDDAHASGEFRAGVLPAYVERAVETAVGRAGGGPR